MSNETKIGLAVRAKDSRYPIPVYIDDAIEPTFTLLFNPGDPFVLQHANDMADVIVKDGTESILAFAKSAEKNLDAIFGDGSARLICRYDGADHALLNAIMDNVRDGYDDFALKAKAAAVKAKTDALIEANKNAQPYIAP